LRRRQRAGTGALCRAPAILGEREVWRVVKVPSMEAEDGRHLHRDLETLKQERARRTTRIKALLKSLRPLFARSETSRGKARSGQADQERGG
jgi:transposase